MSDDIAISVENVSKAYRIWTDSSARLKAPIMDGLSRFIPDAFGLPARLQRRAESYYRDFYALRDVDLQVRKGEGMAIIGRNGSGKSTLLQIIAGTLQPTAGSLQVNGRVAALLELGCGFNPDFTGKENIRLNATVLGIGSDVLEERLESIIAYADIGEFIDQPVKIYSSGMQMRLAFAVAAHVDAEILIIDEALGVGDARFQLKCAKTIDGFVDSGKTLVFVSHDFSSVKRLCRSAVLLEQGHCLLSGEPNPVVNFYSKLIAEPKPFAQLQEEAHRFQHASPAPPPAPAATPPERPTPQASPEAAQLAMQELQGELRRTQQALATLSHLQSAASAIELVTRADQLEPIHARGHEFAYGGSLGRIEELQVLNCTGFPSLVFTTGERMTVSITVRAIETIPAPLYALTIKSANGQDVYVTNTLFKDIPVPPIEAGQSSRITFTLQLNLMAGEYFISVGWVTIPGTELLVIHRRYDALKFQVLPVDRRVGIANLHSEITIESLP